MADKAAEETKTDATILTETKPEAKTAEEKLYTKETDTTEPDKKPAVEEKKTEETADKETKPPTEKKEPGDKQSQDASQTDYDLKPPEGSLVSAEEAKALTEKAKKAGMNKTQAEMLLQDRQDLRQAAKTNEETMMKEARSKWADESKNDPDFGREKFAENAEKAKRIIDRYADNDMKEFLDKSGFGNNPHLFRFMSRLAAHLGEDQLIRGTTGASDRVIPPEEKLYGKTTPARAS